MMPLPLPAGRSLRSLHPDDLPALLLLHAEVMRALPDPAMFRLFGGAEKFLSDHFSARGESLGFFAGERAVAYGSLTLPKADDLDNYARDLGWDAARAGRVALLSAAMVEPSQRGQGLHPSLIAARIRRADELGVPELLVRAAPTNAMSRRTLLASGFVLIWLGVQGEGSLRHVMWRPIDRAAWLADEAAEAALAWVAADDLAKQQELLQSGWIGVRARRSDAAIGFVRARGAR